MTAYEYKIGTSAGTMVLLSDLDIPAPHQNYVPFSEVVDLGSGGVLGQGWPEDEWYWGFLTGSQRATLRTFVPGHGAHIFVRDLMDDGITYDDFECEAVWMKQEDRQTGRRIGFTLVLRAMEAV